MLDHLAGGIVSALYATDSEGVGFGGKIYEDYPKTANALAATAVSYHKNSYRRKYSGGIPLIGLDKYCYASTDHELREDLVDNITCNTSIPINPTHLPKSHYFIHII